MVIALKKVSLMDVAKAAGVSHTTVARVLRGDKSVTPETRALVEEKLLELGYIPNHMARALKTSRSGLLGSLFVHNASGLIHQINERIHQAAREAGYELLVMETHWGEEAQTITQLLSLQVDGVVIISDLFTPPEMLARLNAWHIPVVAVERGYAAAGVDNLLVADYDACYDVGRRIAEAGHWQVGFIGAQEGFGPVAGPALDTEYQRRSGFLAAAAAFQFSVESHIMEDYRAEEGYAAMERLLDSPKPPTAVFCASDSLAAGALQCLYAHGLRVPEAISVIGYDNVLSEQLTPPINSVALVFEEIGSAVLSLLTARMENPEREAVTERIQTAYIDRGTLRKI